MFFVPCELNYLDVFWRCKLSFNLMQAYVGIHRPKNLTEADLARKRLIFDEFFYLQVMSSL